MTFNKIVPDYDPSPTLPLTGRVSSLVCGNIVQEPPAHTLPLVGRAGEGVSL